MLIRMYQLRKKLKHDEFQIKCNSDCCIKNFSIQFFVPFIKYAIYLFIQFLSQSKESVECFDNIENK